MAIYPPPLALLQRGATPIFLLEINWIGRIWRFSTSPVDIQSSDGDMPFIGGLEDPDFAEEIERSGTETAGPSVPIGVIFPGINVAHEKVKGNHLTSATAELSQVLRDPYTGVILQTWEQREVLVTGILSQPSCGWADEEEGYATFSLEDQPFDDNSTILDPRHHINEDTLPLAGPSAEGKAYPLVIGRVGEYRSAGGGPKTTSGSPAYVAVDTDPDLIIAGHQVQAPSVIVFDESGSFDTFAVRLAKDGLSTVYSSVDISAGSISTTDSEYWVGWGVNDLGALRNPYGTGILERAGDVIAYIMSLQATGVDLPKWMAIRPLLNRFVLATYINDLSTSPWVWLQDSGLLELLSIEVRKGPQGLFPIVRDPRHARDHAIASITEGPDWTPAGPLITETEPDDIVNKVTIQFALSAKSGDYRRSITVTGDRDPTYTLSDTEMVASAYATISQSRHSTARNPTGIQSMTVSSDVIYDDATAALIAEELIRIRGFYGNTGEFIAAPIWGWLDVGAYVLCTSTRLGFSAMPAQVISKSWTGQAWAYRLAFDDDPIVSPPRTP